jgi:arylsulfatase A
LVTRVACIIATAIVSAITPAIAAAAPSAPRPNIVLIMADDFGYECVTANGGESYRTPQLDRLAATGLRFTHCYVQPLCTPTRVELMTGKSNVRNYVRFGLLPPTERTFANILKDAGYATAICGKWQLGKDPTLPRHFGFDESYLWQHTRRPPRYANPGLELNGVEQDYRDGEYGPSLVNDFALDFITRQAAMAKSGEKPFFLYYPMMLTHGPFQPTPDSDDWDPRAVGEKMKRAPRHFADMTAFMDKLIGRLVDRLEELELRENTLILFLGDNGTGGGLVSRFKGTDFKGGKGQTTHRGMHVPGIANWPGHVPAGRVCDDLVTAVDFLPTICEITGVAGPPVCDGISFAAQLRGDPGSPRDWIYCWYSPRLNKVTKPRVFAFDQHHKLYADGTLYDLAADPDERYPIRSTSATAAAAAGTKLRAALDRFANARPKQLDAEQGTPADEDEREQAVDEQKRPEAADGRPNILWLVAEDTSADSLACYGNTLTRTPNLDTMAARGIVFDRCFTNPVCAPSRFTLITGIHAASCGPAHHMRAQGRIPADLTGFPALLRSAGYYTTNNAKTDYNSPIDVSQIWDASGKAAHYRNRPEPGQPFFAVFNHEVTHESCLFPERDPDLPVPPTDPATVRIPPYQPDTPEMRADWARQTDRIAWLDLQIQKKLDELAMAGLADDTIVFFFGDNGGVTPRSKRFLQASGTRVPLIVHFPPKWRHLAPADPGSRLTDPVGFVDFAATVLAIAGVPGSPRTHGRPFAGPAPLTNEHAFCSRDRMDERYDMSRSVIDRRWLYIRHFRPDIPFVRPLDYQFRGRGYQSWARAARAGSLTPDTARFWGRKPAEELYDLEADPDNVQNLAADPAHRDEIIRLRAALRRHAIEIHDNGLLPEGSPHEGYDQSRDPVAFPVERVFDLAVLASEGDAGNLPAFVAALDDLSEPVRWWAAQGCTLVAAGASTDGFPEGTEAALRRRLNDDSIAVRVAAAEALLTAGRGEPAFKTFEEVLREGDRWPMLQAVNALDRLGQRARPSLPVLKDALATAERNAIPDNAPGGRADRYGRDLLAYLITVLEGTKQPLVYPQLR